MVPLNKEQNEKLDCNATLDGEQARREKIRMAGGCTPWGELYLDPQSSKRETGLLFTSHATQVGISLPRFSLQLSRTHHRLKPLFPVAHSSRIQHVCRRLLVYVYRHHVLGGCVPDSVLCEASVVLRAVVVYLLIKKQMRRKGCIGGLLCPVAG